MAREQSDGCRLSDLGDDAVLAKKPPEPPPTGRVRLPVGAGVPDGPDQLVQVAKGQLRSEIQPEQTAAGGAGFTIPERGPEKSSDGRMRETQRI